MSKEVLRELILELTEPDRLEIIREAGIRDDRPPLLRGNEEDGPVEEADSWATQNGAGYSRIYCEESILQTGRWFSSFKAECYLSIVGCWRRANSLSGLITRRCAVLPTVSCHFPKSRRPHLR